MNDEDLEPLKLQEKQVNLDEMSIEAIGEYIAKLEAEIARAQSAVKLKKDARDGANSLFKV
ncbi:MAG: DUF1192 domain-containing protein [Rhodospirillaceae bacterium]|nr:DUF1192 domain-containing protein [Rhodospirillaceae bacterium]